MLVNSAAHVFDVNIPQPSFPLSEMIRDRNFSMAVQMTDIDGQTKAGMIDPIFQFREASHEIDKHSWLRLESQANTLFLCVVAQTPTAVRQSVPQDRFIRLVHRYA